MVYKIFTPKFERIQLLFVKKECTPKEYYLCQWQTTQEISIWYVLYRLLMTIVTVTIMILSIVNQIESDADSTVFKWFIYMTHWGYLIIVIQFLFATGIICTKCYMQFLLSRQEEQTKENKESNHVSVIHKMYGILHSMATVIAFGVTVLYWILIYDPELNELDFMNLALHAFNSVIMIIDLIMVSHPMFLLHILYPFMFAVVYSFFTYFYYLAGGTGKNGRPEIYPILNWNRPVKSIIIAVGAIVFLLVVYLFTYTLVCVRKYCKYKHCGPNGGDVVQESNNTVQSNDIIENNNQNVNRQERYIVRDVVV